MKKRYFIGATALAAAVSLGAATSAFADTSTPAHPPAWGHNRPMNGNGYGRMGRMGQGVFGTVTSINGTTLTVSGHQGFSTSTPAVTFTVDASNAKVMKNKDQGSVSNVVVGDTVAVMGTINGTNVTATMIRDGVTMRMGGTIGPGQGAPAPITGNGQPIVAGSVAAINGSTITITNKSNVQYTIDASGAKIVQGQNTVSASAITVGDNVIVQGSVNGSSVTASSIIDQVKPHLGFFGGIGQFFSHLFGF